MLDMFQAVHAVKIDSQVQLSRAVLEERTQKDIALQQALAQTRAAGIKTENVTIVAHEDKSGNLTYTWPSSQTIDTSGKESPAKN